MSTVSWNGSKTEAHLCLSGLASDGVLLTEDSTRYSKGHRFLKYGDGLGIPPIRTWPSSATLCVFWWAHLTEIEMHLGFSVLECFLPKWNSTRKVCSGAPLRLAMKGSVSWLNGCSIWSTECSNCKTQCATLSRSPFISSVFVFFFHFNFKTVIDHHHGQDPKLRHNIAPSFQGWQEEETLKESRVSACVEWEAQFTP